MTDEGCAIPCNLCGSRAVESVRRKDRHGQPLRSVICRRCGLVWSDPRPTPEKVREFYANEYRLDYKGTYSPRLKHTFRNGKAALARLRTLAPLLLKGCRVCDVGAGSGETVYMMRAFGFDASGIEPNEGYARHAANVLGLPVSHGFFQETTVAPLSQDAVTIFHALEHLEDPLAMMRTAGGWLRQEGFLVIEVPNVESRANQPHTQFHTGHLYHFNLAVLEAMGKRSGFRMVQGLTTPDGGNITAVFRKEGVANAESAEMPENYRRVSGILSKHTALRHAFSPHPYFRPLRKLSERIQEQVAIRSGPSHREVLDALVRSARMKA